MTSWIKSASILNRFLFMPQHTTPFSAHQPLPSLSSSHTSIPFSHGVFWLTNSQDTPFPCLWVPAGDTRCPHVMMYFHGNACNIFEMREELEEYARCLGVSVLAVEYPGYGPAGGAPSEASVDDNVQTAYNFITRVCDVNPAHVLIMGRSIGTGPAVRLAARLCQQSSTTTTTTTPAALVLQSPYTSVVDIVRGLAGTWGRVASVFLLDRWQSLASIEGVTCPLLLVHGEDDTLIPASHSRRLHAAAATPAEHKELLAWQGVDHNTFHPHRHVIGPLQRFLERNIVLRVGGGGGAKSARQFRPVGVDLFSFSQGPPPAAEQRSGGAGGGKGVVGSIFSSLATLSEASAAATAASASSVVSLARRASSSSRT